MLIKRVSAREIKDSRGERTIEVSVNGYAASSPSGKSTGKYESKPYYKDIGFCAKFLNSWQEKAEIEVFDDLKKVEKAIVEKLRLRKANEFGGNSLFAFECAILKALAKEKEKELWEIVNPRARKLPIPVGNCIGGGLHSTSFKKHPVFQEFLLVPMEKSFGENFDTMKETYEQIGRRLNAKGKNDEGAWNAGLDDEEILRLLSDYKSETRIGIDVASSSFFDRIYRYKKISRTPEKHLEHVIFLAKTYGVFYLEDPMHEEDFEGFAKIRKELPGTLVVGDDLTATHKDRLEKAIEMRSINAMIVKPNQNGSLIEVKEIMEICKKHNIVRIISHRSGETMDDALGDIAFGMGAEYIKAGISTKWREAKLLRLKEIEANL